MAEAVVCSLKLYWGVVGSSSPHLLTSKTVNNLPLILLRITSCLDHAKSMVGVLTCRGLRPPFPSVEVCWLFGAKASQDRERQTLHALGLLWLWASAGAVSLVSASHKKLPTSSLSDRHTEITVVLLGLYCLGKSPFFGFADDKS